ncbi:carboxypeptidase-like regulatory domain-containing protein, partial [Algoriphagus boritolerans]|uniref:carboxypeptidase-like regulatory domain-containing protein n=1 Tax=Algoriphagus boritolerans TaxID=308111 RepID=UPI002FCE38BD
MPLSGATAQYHLEAKCLFPGSKCHRIRKTHRYQRRNADRSQILIKNEQTGFTASTVTGGTGNYIVSQIPLGNDYTVTASYLGFGTKSITGLVLNQGNV